ncbi:hypothetical protein [Streptomyces sp. NPDC059761]|uniref:hypothetical protein n=1 Tax=Streptomyces sp. NPDC059761 TaxID=3346937 RepID=UPI00365DC4D0
MIRLDNTVLSTTLETLADPVRIGDFRRVLAVGGVGIAVLVPNFRSPVLRPLDPAGMVLSVSGLAALAYRLIHAGQVAAWARTGSSGCRPHSSGSRSCCWSRASSSAW